MSYDYNSIENRLRAKRMLETLCKEVKTEPQQDGHTLEAGSGMGAAAIPYIKISNVAGIHIYHSGGGLTHPPSARWRGYWQRRSKRDKQKPC